MNRDEKYYDLICATDPINPVMDLLRAGKFSLDDDFKIVVKGEKGIEREWLNAAHDSERNCALWHRVYFERYKIIPRGCRNCWKCSIKIRTLEDLFKVRDFQLTNLDQPSKCGLEQRGYTANLGRYAAFWYCDLSKGLKGARSLWNILNEKLTTLLGKGHGLGVKRGCTEFELHTIDMGMGGSEKWDDFSEGWDAYEDILDHIYILNRKEPAAVPWWIEKSVERRWIEWAFEHGDPTYIKYTGAPLTRPLETYHGDSIHSERDFQSTWDEGKARTVPLNGIIEGTVEGWIEGVSCESTVVKGDKDESDQHESGHKSSEESGGGDISPIISLV